MYLPVFPSQGTTIFPGSLSPYVAAVIFESLLYGIYLALFLVYLFTLPQRSNVIHWSFATVMFAIATADIIYTYYLVFARLLGTGLTFSQIYPKYPLTVTNNSLAGGLLIYRFFIIWGSKKRFVVGPILLLLGGTVCGYLFEGPCAALFRHSWIYLFLTCCLNFIVTLLTVGRIWWISRASRSSRYSNSYNTAICILVETGVMYCIYIILDLALQHNKTANIILDAGLIQVAGIMPTLIIVRVRLKRVQDLSKDMEANKCPTLSIMRARPSFFAPTKALSSREVGFPTPSPVSSRLASPQRAFSGLIRSPSVQILDDNALHLSISLTCSTISRETCY